MQIKLRVRPGTQSLAVLDNDFNLTGDDLSKGLVVTDKSPAINKLRRTQAPRSTGRPGSGPRGRRGSQATRRGAAGGSSGRGARGRPRRSPSRSLLAHRHARTVTDGDCRVSGWAAGRPGATQAHRHRARRTGRACRRRSTSTAAARPLLGVLVSPECTGPSRTVTVRRATSSPRLARHLETHTRSHLLHTCHILGK